MSSYVLERDGEFIAEHSTWDAIVAEAYSHGAIAAGTVGDFIGDKDRRGERYLFDGWAIKEKDDG